MLGGRGQEGGDGRCRKQKTLEALEDTRRPEKTQILENRGTAN